MYNNNLLFPYVTIEKTVSFGTVEMVGKILHPLLTNCVMLGRLLNLSEH